MSYEDKSLKCKYCGAEFVFTSGEQEFYASKGFENEPQRCPACREEKQRNKRANKKNAVTVICAQCGCETTVPFTPSGAKPVYCRSCYDARMNK